MSVPPIEFLKDRIYFAAYDSPPKDTASVVHFTIDDELPYNAFYHEFGPLHIGHLYRFAVILHEILGEESNAGKAVCLYSRNNPRDRANAACVLCCYMVLLQSWPPHLAVAPISQADPPFMPFRDAGYAPADFVLTIQDVVYAVWRAKEHGLLDLRSFNLEEYERYERVDQGDFNEIPPHFIAFASPSQTPSERRNGIINYPAQQVLDYFVSHNVQLVFRLNSPLYDKSIFEDHGIKHIDLIFDDGTCPTMDYVKCFIGAVEGVIQTPGAKVAVHCKAGLGRTGCLIGAHLIYTYGFTAQEAIAYMRFMRPGMVVGPQQHWLYLHQHEFRDWKRTMTVSSSASEKLAGFCPLVPKTSMRAARSRLSSGVYSPGGSPPKTPERSILREVAQNSALPVPTPGQPRKTSPMARSVLMASARKPVHDSEPAHDDVRKASVYHDASSDPAGDAVLPAEDSESEMYEILNERNANASSTPIASKEDMEDVGNDTVVDNTMIASADEPNGDVQSSPRRSRPRGNAVSAPLNVMKRRGNNSSSTTSSRSTSNGTIRSASKPNSSSKALSSNAPVVRGITRTASSRTTTSGSPDASRHIIRSRRSISTSVLDGKTVGAFDDVYESYEMETYPDDGYDADEYNVYNDEYDDYNVYQDGDLDAGARRKANVRVVEFAAEGHNSDEEYVVDGFTKKDVDYDNSASAALVRREAEYFGTNSDDENFGDAENRYVEQDSHKARKTSSRRSSSPIRRVSSVSSSPSRRSSAQLASSSGAPISPSRRSSVQLHSASILPGKRPSLAGSSNAQPNSPPLTARSASQRQQMMRVRKLRSSSGPIVAGGVQVTKTTTKTMTTETTEFVSAASSPDSHLRHTRVPSGVRKISSGSGTIRR